MTQLLDVHDVATLLAIHPASVYRWAKEGRFIQPLRLAGTAARWSSADVETWLAEQRERSAPRIYETI